MFYLIKHFATANLKELGYSTKMSCSIAFSVVKSSQKSLMILEMLLSLRNHLAYEALDLRFLLN